MSISSIYVSEMKEMKKNSYNTTLITQRKSIYNTAKHKSFKSDIEKF